MNKKILSVCLALFFCDGFAKQKEPFISAGSLNKRNILAYKSDDLPENYNSLTANKKQEILWDQIVKTKQSNTTNKWDATFGLKRLLSVSRIKSSIHSWLFKADAVTPRERDAQAKGVKLLHTHGVVAKCNFQIDIKNISAFKGYTGWFNPKNNKFNIPCVIRLSLFNMDKSDFSPGVALKLLRDAKFSVNNHFMYKFEGFKTDEEKHFLKHLVRTEVPEISIIDDRNFFTKLFANAKEKVFNYVLQRGLSGTVITAEKIASDINLKTKYDFKKRRPGQSGGIFHRPLHLNGGYPEIKNPFFFPRHLALYSPSAKKINSKADGTPWGTDMSSENFRRRLNLLSKELKNTKVPLYQVYVQHTYSPCQPEKRNPWCIKIKNGKIKVLDDKNIDLYGNIYLKSEFISSSWADSNLVFQHTF